MNGFVSFDLITKSDNTTTIMGITCNWIFICSYKVAANKGYLETNLNLEDLAFLHIPKYFHRLGFINNITVQYESKPAVNINFEICQSFHANHESLYK